MAILVQYRVKAERAEENEAFIRRVFESLDEEKPSGVRYASFKAADGVSFTHLAVVETEDGHNPLAALRAFQQFVAHIRDRCEPHRRRPSSSKWGPTGCSGARNARDRRAGVPGSEDTNPKRTL